MIYLVNAANKKSHYNHSYSVPKQMISMRQVPLSTTITTTTTTTTTTTLSPQQSVATASATL